MQPFLQKYFFFRCPLRVQKSFLKPAVFPSPCLPERKAASSHHRLAEKKAATELSPFLPTAGHLFDPENPTKTRESPEAKVPAQNKRHSQSLFGTLGMSLSCFSGQKVISPALSAAAPASRWDCPVPWTDAYTDPPGSPGRCSCRPCNPPPLWGWPPAPAGRSPPGRSCR